jgi:hypothetical protein
VIRNKSKNILILSFSDLGRDPRVYRQIIFLEGRYGLTAAGFGSPKVDGVHFVPIEREKKAFHQKILRSLRLKWKQFENYYWASRMVLNVLNSLKGNRFDLIIANDLDTLPLALYLSKEHKAMVLLDAHEYTPRQWDDRWMFRFFLKDYWDYICRRYLPQVDDMITVSTGIAKEYEKNYGILPHIITNAPFYQDLQPSPVKNEHIRIVHHGGVNPSRRIENMIYLMDFLDERFTLDLILMPNNPKYFSKLQNLALSRPRIQFLPPVPMREIPRKTNQYDIGLFLLWPEAFNYRMALPNKLFEFIQARLAVAIWPSPEMARLVKECNCGVVSEDFSLKSTASILNSLTHRDIWKYKQKAHVAAKIMNAESNQRNFLNIVRNLIG